MLNFDSIKKADAKAIELLAKMRERFPEKLLTISITHWEDAYFSVECRHADNKISHVYTYRSSRDQTEYLKIDISNEPTYRTIGHILKKEIIS